MNDANAVKRWKEFKVDGINSDLTDSEIAQIKDINLKLNTLQDELDYLENKCSTIPTKTFSTAKGETFTRKVLAVDVDFSLTQQALIFTCGKSKYTIYFLNRRKKLCCVDSSDIRNSTVYLSITLDIKDKCIPTKLTLDRFLYLIEIGDFIITNKAFCQHYLKPYTESNTYKNMIIRKEYLTQAINDILTSDFYIRMENIYKTKAKELSRDYSKATSGLTRAVEPEEAKNKKKSKIEKTQGDLKTLWNSAISEAEKAFFMGWLCKHILHIDIKVVAGGVSDQVISTAFPDSIYGDKYREKANSSGWDASSGKIKVDNISNAPIQTIKALSTLKHVRHSSNTDNIFNDSNTINNLDLTLFILSKYNPYGFKSRVKSLNKMIDWETLRDVEFPDNIEDFNRGYEV